MATPWIYILLSSGCAVLVAHYLKRSEHQTLDTLRVLTVNYLAAFGLALVSSELFQASVWPSFTTLLPVLVLALFTGLLFIGNYFLYSKSVDRNGVGISVAAMRLSLILPVLLSVAGYGEHLDLRRWIGVLTVFSALWLLLPERITKKSVTNRTRNTWFLLLLFLMTGTGDSFLKIFETEYSMILSREQFLAAVFLVAGGAGCLLLAQSGRLSISRQEWKAGLLVGIPNYFSATLLIAALSVQSGAVVYTAANLLTMAGAVMVGYLLWQDTVSARQWAGLVLSVLSILLLV